MHFCSTMFWIVSEPGALYNLSFLIALQMLSLVNMPFAFNDSGYAMAGMMGVSGGGGKKVSASAFASAVFSDTRISWPLGSLVLSEGIRTFK